MIDWLLSNHHRLVSRWIIVACAIAILAIADLPPSPLDRILAIAGLLGVGLFMLLWLAIVLITLLRPRTFAELRLRRAEGAETRNRELF